MATFVRALMFLGCAVAATTAFVCSSKIPLVLVVRHAEEEGNFFQRFMKEVDNFVDDASSRRLGNVK